MTKKYTLWSISVTVLAVVFQITDNKLALAAARTYTIFPRLIVFLIFSIMFGAMLAIINRLSINRIISLVFAVCNAGAVIFLFRFTGMNYYSMILCGVFIMALIMGDKKEKQY